MNNHFLLKAGHVNPHSTQPPAIRVGTECMVLHLPALRISVAPRQKMNKQERGKYRMQHTCDLLTSYSSPFRITAGRRIAPLKGARFSVLIRFCGVVYNMLLSGQLYVSICRCFCGFHHFLNASTYICFSSSVPARSPYLQYHSCFSGFRLPPTALTFLPAPFHLLQCAGL